MTAVSSWHAAHRCAYTYRRSSGVDPDALARITDGFGSVDKDKAKDLGYEVLPGTAWLEQAVDVMIPAALENQITETNAPRVHGSVRVIVEAANGPTTSDASRLLEERGVFLIPDVLANAGGVAVTSSRCKAIQTTTGIAPKYCKSSIRG